MVIREVERRTSWNWMKSRSNLNHQNLHCFPKIDSLTSQNSSCLQNYLHRWKTKRSRSLNLTTNWRMKTQTSRWTIRMNHSTIAILIPMLRRNSKKTNRSLRRMAKN